MSSKALRSLMKDRQLAKRIQHQFARYDGLGRLTCTICNGLTVKSEALWPSHLSSKPHRVNYQRHQSTLNSATAPTPAVMESTPSKRKPDEEESEGDNGRDAGSQEKKVRLTGPSTDENASQPAVQPNQSSSSLPANFFDDPSQAPQPVNQSSSDQDPHLDEDDPEWAAFQAALEHPAPQQDDAPANVFAQASVVAEPVLYGSQSESLNIDRSGAMEDVEEEAEEEEDPIEKKIREEKEEIMDRIQNEEREQLEADQRVIRMKARLEALRSKRNKSTNGLPTPGT